MSKTVPLKNSTAAVKSAERLPAPPTQREYGDFDAFVENADKLTTFFNRSYEDESNLNGIKFEWLEWPEGRPLDLKNAKAGIVRPKTKVQLARYTLRDFPQARKRLAEYKRDEKWYDRKELYEIKGKGKREKWTLSRRVVSEQIALLLASFQNSRPGTPKVFARMLTEEVYANNPNAIVLESACRRVRREKDFPPSIAEVLKAIKEEDSAWCDRWCDEYDPDKYRQDLEQAIAKAEAKIALAEAKLAEREAKEQAAEAKCKAYREAYDRIPVNERRAFEDGQRHRRFREMDRPEIPEEYCDESHLREFHAYHAGLAGEEIPGLELKTNGAASEVRE
jgi:hypothetical protein